MDLVNFTPSVFAKTAQLPLPGFEALGAPGPQGTVNGLGFPPLRQYSNGDAFEIDGFPDPVVRQYQLDYNGKTAEQGSKDIDLHTVAFARVNEHPFGIKTPLGSAKRPLEMPTVVMSGPRLNQYLRSSAGRARYSGPKAPEKVATDWRFLGVPMTAQTADTRSRGEQSITMCVAKRARSPNIWLGTGREPALGQELWLIVKRMPIKGLLSVTMETDEKKTVGVENLSLPDDEKKTQSEDYVQILPFITEKGERPSSALEAEGSKSIFVGTVSETHGKVNLAIHCSQAKEAFCPLGIDDEYKHKLVALPHIVYNVNLHA